LKCFFGLENRQLTNNQANENQTKMSQTVNVPAPKYTVANVGKYIKHDLDDDDYDGSITNYGCVTTRFIWSRDDKLHKIARDEYRYHIGDKRKNLMWVEELKRIADWKEGEYIYAFLKSNGGMYFTVHYKKDKKDNFHWYNLIVEPSGYVCMEAMNLYTLDSDEDIKCGKNFIRVESVYNDKNCKTLNKKKAKAKATAKK